MKPGTKADSTLRSSQAVPHPSTNRALCCLTSEVKRDPVHSTRYGRRREIQYFERILKTAPQMETGACEACVHRAPCRRPVVVRPRREKGNRAKHPEHKTKNTRPDTRRRKSHTTAKELTTTSTTTSQDRSEVVAPFVETQFATPRFHPQNRQKVTHKNMNFTKY